MKQTDVYVGKSRRLYFMRAVPEASPFGNPSDYVVEIEGGDADEISTTPAPGTPARSTGYCPVTVRGIKPGRAQINVQITEPDGTQYNEAVEILVHSDQVLTSVSGMF